MPESVVDLASLNPAQREAVLCTEGPLLVLAGAGSGKTRVLTHRIAHMIGDEGVRPWQVLAITFTNKAAAEMRERLGTLLPGGTRGMWVCTFHAMGVRILREDAELLGYRPNFSIYDDDDSKRLVKAIMADLDIDPKQFPLNMVRSKISAAKNALVSPEEMAGQASDPPTEKAARVYAELERRLLRANAMDFDDLLVNTLALFERHPEVLARYQDRFLQISVDEYQDTNHVQYKITNLLAQKHQNLMVVGDDDQSIYSWRGADIQNILDFEHDYPAAKVVKLQQNYRSTGHILAAANAVVANNSKRKPKRLFTEEGQGEPIHAYQASDERDEGRWIAAECEKLHTQGTSYNDMAVFYRTNAQSRVLEDMFLRAGVPYKIAGGTRFFDRAEIRDVMAYLKLVVNPADDVSALRVVNVPRRGIGATSVKKIQAYAARNGLSFFEAAQACVAEAGLLSPKVRNALAAWTSGILEARAYDGELSRVVEMIIEKSGILTALEAESTVEAASRAENIKEFLLIASEFAEDHDDVAATLESLAQLREAGALDANEAQEAEELGLLEEPPAQDPDEVGQLSFFSDLDVPAPVVPKEAAAVEPVASAMLPAFMEWLALRSDLDSLSGQTSAVTMMTIHSAKGLEFPVVFVAGLEEGLFPNLTYDADPAKLEEERRLAYVAITRARQRLYLTYAATRRTYGSTQANPRSRFVNEIPESDIRLVGVGSAGFGGTGWEKRGDRRGTYGSGQGSDMYGGAVFGSRTRSTGGSVAARPASAVRKDEKKAAETFQAGDRVSHKTFGAGVVLAAEGDVIEVRFSKSGQTKKLMKGFAPIVKIAN
ncbi:UvrD-helicase domain-containing protein [Olsenella sp. YH-ols2217]|uniref:DNA 3'-5' helicase n=1 Tax=Kribbibacterium absianum TaxID=3044210 RepID=A0ABT6ZL07_9ACTN|nr:MULTISPECIES: UvrD-helicase domain-containing protein [unclassified Olsenella]MDJ1121722.1 UvrD-helicase domain-containing protein [Olsenella sp. YH-ols2216]MDJ1129730.1 UvrD-helicase domain-containing protein [Olsenella sp. YH-ols2217]